MRNLPLVLLFPWLLAACARPVVTQTRGDVGSGLTHDGGLSVSLRTLLITDTGERSIAESEALHTGDHVYFLVRTSQPAYLYAVLFGVDGSSTTLWPQEPGSEQKIAANCALRIPAQGSFYLQTPAGVEDLRVVAAPVPLAQADRRLCEELRLPCQKTAADPTAAPECPQAARAVFSAVKVATATARGVAALRMTLRHEP